MSEGGKIEIKVGVTGGSESAAEIKKVEVAADNLAGGKGTGKGLKAIQEETQKVTVANVKMGTGMQNVGYQVQDLAVQIGSGTSAFRAMGQQLPQLLSGFGPWGIALGTISAIALPLGAALFNMADATEELGDATAKAAEETVKMAREQANSLEVEQQSLDRKAELAEVLREVTVVQYSFNESLQKQLDILKETQALENEVAAAKGQLAIDKVGDDPVAKEQETNKVRKEAQEREIRQIEERKKAANELIARKGAQELGVGEAGDAAAKRLRDEAAAAGASALEKEQLAKTQEAIATERGDFAKKAPIGGARAQAQIDADQARAVQLAAEKESLAARAKEKDLNSQAGTVETTTAAEVKRLQGEAQKLFDEVNKGDRESSSKRQVFGARNEQGDLRESRLQKQADDAQARKSQQAELETRQGKLSETATGNQARIQRGGKTAGGLQKIADDIGNADTEREIAAVAAKINAAQGQLGAATVAALTQMLAVQQEQVKAIAILQKQLKNR